MVYEGANTLVLVYIPGHVELKAYRSAFWQLLFLRLDKEEMPSFLNDYCTTLDNHTVTTYNDIMAVLPTNIANCQFRQPF